jgi:hypothetical protein
MSRLEATTRVTPWLLLCAFCLTLSTLALRDTFSSSLRFAAEPPPVQLVVVSH